MELFKILEEVKNRPVSATLNSLYEFKESFVWRDIQNELNSWLIDSWELLEKENSDLLRGRIRTIRETLQLIDNLIYRKEKEL